MKDSLITEAETFFAASKNRDYRNRIIMTLDVFIRYLQTHGLTTRTLLGETDVVDVNTKLMASDLTEEGLQLVTACYNKWLKSHDRGKPITDMTIFDKELNKLRK